MDADIGHLECSLYLADLVSCPSDIVLWVQRVNDHQFCSRLPLLNERKIYIRVRHELNFGYVHVNGLLGVKL